MFEQRVKWFYAVMTVAFADLPWDERVGLWQSVVCRWEASC